MKHKILVKYALNGTISGNIESSVTYIITIIFEYEIFHCFTSNRAAMCIFA